ncbi:MAG TPA: HEAT repeat domain-containing protein [Longimicrobium sp.]|jgi:hypothetical protein
MGMNLHRTVIRVFVASPGDLAPERQIARETVDEMNRTLGRELDFQIDLLGWEDTLPGVGRPQGLINRDVDTCDLFIGILWKRWGTPSGNDYTSGFEEEFERAQRRAAESGDPEIWLAFKKIDEALLADPGDQLRRVVAFKQAQIAARAVLFKEFSDEQDWRRQLRAWLLTHIAQWIKSARTAQEAAGEPESNLYSENTFASARTPFDIEADSAVLPEQLRNAGAVLARAIHAESEERYLGLVGDIGKFEMARLHLLTKAWLSSRETQELLSSHEIQLLYPERERVEFVYPENQLVWRSLLGDKHDVRVGWFWFHEFEPGTLPPYVIELARSDALPEVRQSVLEVMELCGIYPPPEEAQQFVYGILHDSDESVQRAAAKYVALFGDSTVVSLLDEIASSSDVVAYTAKLEAFRLRARVDPRSALQNVPRTLDAIGKEYTAALSVHLKSVPVEVLVDAAKSAPDRAVRRVVVEELSRRGELDVALANELLSDRSMKVREHALQALIRAGATITASVIRRHLTRESDTSGSLPSNPFDDDNVDIDQVVEALFEREPVRRVKAEIDWFEIDGSTAYMVWARKQKPAGVMRIREDLKSDFKRVHRESQRRLLARYGPVAAQVEESFAKYNSLFLSRLRAAGLSALVSHGATVDDLPLIKELLAHSSPWESGLREAAIAGIGQIGGVADVEQLLQIAQGAYGRVRAQALRTAVSLSPGIDGVAPELLRSNTPEFVRAGIAALTKRNFEQVSELVFPLLFHPDSAIRRPAIGYFVFVYPESELAEILNRYLTHETYYYNVVCWFDRALYAPPELREGYMLKLLAEERGAWSTLD